MHNIKISIDKLYYFELVYVYDKVREAEAQQRDEKILNWMTVSIFVK